jgi:hypothetical protein
MQLVHGKSHQWGVSSIDMNTEHLERGTAVRPTRTAGWTGAAESIGLDRTEIARMQSRADRSGNDLDAEFVTEDAGIAEKGLPSGKCMDVRAADTAAADADECLAFTRHGSWRLLPDKGTGLI